MCNRMAPMTIRSSYIYVGRFVQNKIKEIQIFKKNLLQVILGHFYFFIYFAVICVYPQDDNGGQACSICLCHCIGLMRLHRRRIRGKMAYVFVLVIAIGCVLSLNCVVLYCLCSGGVLRVVLRWSWLVSA
jgi:hypothetical protein